MKITLKLFATLTDYLPPEAKGNQAEVEVGEAAAVGDVIAQYRLPTKLVHLVLVNGSYVGPDDRNRQVLKDGDQLAVWPPIAGG